MSGRDRQHIGICLSGGGHRASLFGLGALMYLVDAGKGPEISAVSSVSGGSLTNGWVGLHADLTTVAPDAFRKEASALATQIAERGTLWASRLSYLLMFAIALPLVGALAVSLVWGTPAAYLAWPIAIALSSVIGQRRSWAARRAFDQTLFHGQPLSAMHSGVDHVICATELQSGENVFFSSRFVYSWLNGFGVAGGMSVGTAVQASAALPGVFPPVSLSAAPHRFSKPGALRRFLFSDGGVYDNMGDEWLLSVPAGFGQADAVPDPAPNRIDEAVVINSSSSTGVVKRGWLRVPLLGELFTLLAVKDVLYDQSTAVRRRLLYLRSKVAAHAPQMEKDALPGAIIQISRSPFAIPSRFAHGDDEMARRAGAMITALGSESEAEWQAIADANKNVHTTLSKIPRERAVQLLRHAYVLTMADAHVLLGYPLLAVPSADEAETWLA